MTVKEMHIQFDTEYQYIASESYGNFEGGELDLLINNCTLDYINNILDPPESNTRVKNDFKFQVNQRQVDRIKELLVIAERPVYKNDIETGYCTLPFDYKNLVADSSYVKNNCDGLTISETNVTEYYSIIPFKDSINTTPFIDFKITVDEGDKIPTFDNADYYTSGIANERKFELISRILEELNSKSTVQCFWESYGNIYKRNSFIIVSLLNFTVDVIDNSITTTYTAISTTLVSQSFTNATSAKQTNRLISTEDLTDIQGYTFSKSIPTSPVSYLIKDKLYILYNKFVVEKVQIHYIKTPRLISLELGINSELSDTNAKEVVQLAVRKAQAMTDNPNFRNNLILKQVN